MIYKIYNAAMPTTSGVVPVLTGTSLKTLLQVKLGTQNPARVIEYGISFNGSAAATPGMIELIETGTVFGTVTASTANDIVKWDDPNAIDPTTSNIVVGTTATGYTCTSEGSITTSRLLDAQQIAPTIGAVLQYPLGRECKVNVSSALRIRVQFGASVSALCYVLLEIG